MLSRFPKNIGINAEVFVDSKVAQPTYLPPGNRRIALYNLIRNKASRLTDDDQIANHCINSFLIFVEVAVRQILRLAVNLLDCTKHVLNSDTPVSSKHEQPL